MLHVIPSSELPITTIYSNSTPTLQHTQYTHPLYEYTYTHTHTQTNTLYFRKADTITDEKCTKKTVQSYGNEPRIIHICE